MSTILSPQQQRAIGWSPATSATFATAASTIATYTVTMTWGTSTTAVVGTNGNTYTGNITGPKWVSPKKLPKRHRIRCRGCARWAKVIDKKMLATGNVAYTVHCERCLGKNPGFIG